jgi:hypothetical protein
MKVTSLVPALAAAALFLSIGVASASTDSEQNNPAAFGLPVIQTQGATPGHASARHSFDLRLGERGGNLYEQARCVDAINAGANGPDVATWCPPSVHGR